MIENNASEKQKYFWNMMGSMCNALSTVILLFLVNTFLGSEQGGVFSFAYSNAQLMLIIGGLEVRPLQSTDVQEEYSFQLYYTLRIITCILMMCICIFYTIFSRCTKEKALILIILSCFKMIEAFTDVFCGAFQQNDRIDLAGKSFSLRVVASTIIFAISLIIWGDLLTGVVLMTLVSFILIFLYDIPILKYLPNIKIGISFEKIDSLVKAAIPLFIAAFIISYISNAPRYAINKYCSDVLQNKYSILFMPAFVINLFSLFVFRPVLVDMTKSWNGYNICKIKQYIKTSTIFISVMTIVCILIGVTVGIPILSIVYNVDLSGDKRVLALIMLYGGINAFGTYFYYVITVMRVQSKILIGYMCAFILVFLLSPVLVKKWQMTGAIWASIIAAAVLDIIFSIIVFMSIQKRRQEAEYMIKREI